MVVTNGSLKLMKAIKYEEIHILQLLPCLLKDDIQTNKKREIQYS